jgi:four helix bundle protein
MSFAESFEDLKVWQRARVLANQTYDTFAKCREYAFRDQIQRAATSVMNNIAEGFERRTKKDFAHFLDLAKGSAGEVRSMLYLGEDRGYITAKDSEPLRADYKELSKSIGALAASLRRAQ